jgi:pimeloyl-ACP methyl ester carboxylesterase
MIPHLSRHYKLFCVDYLGAGDSDKPVSGFGYTIEEQADLIVEMMGALQIHKVHVVGVSYGGAIALNLAARYPERVGRIVSMEGNGINNNKHQKISYGPMRDLLRFPVVGDAVIGVIRSGLVDRFVAKSVMGRAWKDLNDAERKEVMQIVSESNRTASRTSWFHIARALKTSRDFTEEAKRVTTSVLYLYGGNSDYRDMAKANANFLKTHLPDVKIISFQGGIHDLQLQKPAEVAALVLEFLKEGNTEGENPRVHLTHPGFRGVPPGSSVKGGPRTLLYGLLLGDCDLSRQFQGLGDSPGPIPMPLQVETRLQTLRDESPGVFRLFGGRVR